MGCRDSGEGTPRLPALPFRIGLFPVYPSPPKQQRAANHAGTFASTIRDSASLSASSRYLPIIEKKDPEPFPVADPIPKIIGFAGVLGGKIRLAHVVVGDRQLTIRHGELRVNGDGSLKVGDA